MGCLSMNEECGGCDGQVRLAGERVSCQVVLLALTYFDGFVKSRHSGEPGSKSGAGSGAQKFCNPLIKLDSGFRRNDMKWCFLTFYETILLDSLGIGFPRIGGEH